MAETGTSRVAWEPKFVRGLCLAVVKERISELEERPEEITWQGAESTR